MQSAVPGNNNDHSLRHSNNFGFNQRLLSKVLKQISLNHRKLILALTLNYSHLNLHRVNAGRVKKSLTQICVSKHLNEHTISL